MHVPAWPVLPSSTLAQNEIAEKFRVPSLMGLGLQMCNEETCWDDGSGTGAGGSPGGSPSTPTISSSDWTKIIGGATAGVTDIAKLVLIQPGTVQQGGTTIRQTPGFAVPVPATQTGVNLKANTGSGLIIAAAAVGIAALFLFKGKN